MAQPQTPRPRRRRHPFRWIFGSLGVLILLVAIFIAVLPYTPLAKSFVERKLQDRLGVPVASRSMDLTWIGPQRVEDLQVGEPEGFPRDENLLRAGNVRIESSLFALLFRPQAPLEVRVEEPVAVLRRNRDGRFNFESLLKEEKEEPRPGPERRRGEVPKFDRSITFVLEGGRIDYIDEALGTSSQLTGMKLDFKLDPEEAHLEARALIGSAAAGGGGQGEFSVSGSAQGLSRAASYRELVAELEAEAKTVDLRPYRALLEKVFRVTPPDKPVSGWLGLETGNGSVIITNDLDAVFLRVTRGVLQIPLEPGGAPASLRLPLWVDLPAASASLGALAGLPEGTRTQGRLEGTLEVTAPVSLEDLARRGVAALEKFSVKLESTAEGLQVARPGDEVPLVAAADGAPVTLRFDLSGSGRDGLSPASLEAEGQLAITGKLLHGETSLENLESQIKIGGGELVIGNFEAGLNGGSVKAEEIAVGLRGQPAPFRLKLDAQKVGASYELSELLAYVAPFLSLENRKAVFSGSINAALAITGEGFTRPDLERTLKGNGSLRVADGKIDASKLLNKAAEVLGGTLESVLFAECGSDFEIGGGRISSKKVFLTAREGSKVRELGLQGSTGLDGSLDYGVQMKVLEEMIGDRKIREILKTAQQWLQGGALPLRLQGTLSTPLLALDLKLQPGPVPGVPGLPKIPGLPDIPIPELPKIPGLGSFGEQPR